MPEAASRLVVERKKSDGETALQTIIDPDHHNNQLWVRRIERSSRRLVHSGEDGVIAGSPPYVSPWVAIHELSIVAALAHLLFSVRPR